MGKLIKMIHGIFQVVLLFLLVVSDSKKSVTGGIGIIVGMGRIEFDTQSNDMDYVGARRGLFKKQGPVVVRCIINKVFL